MDERGRDDELEALREELIAQAGGLDALRALAPARPEGTAGRRTHRRPEPGEDPLGAVLRWCDVEPSGEGPLSGMRVSVKDSIAVAGVPMSCGFRALEGFVPARDSVVVERLRRAGARVVAVTNMDCLGMAAGGETSGYGITRNPHDRARTAGGSSSGAAAGLSHPRIDLALGTDQGGSIRVPASWCGVLGLKPTHGLVPYTGCAGIDPVLDHVGPLATSTAELAAVLDAIAGADPSDPRQRDVPQRDYGAVVARAPERLGAVRVGVLAEGFAAAVGVTDAVAAAARETATRLGEMGADVREVSVPEHLTGGPPSLVCNLEGLAALLDGFPAGGAPDFTHALGAALARAADELSPQVRASWAAGAELRRRFHGAAYAAALEARPAYQAAYDRALAEVDVLLMPTTPFPAYVPPQDGDVGGLVERGWAMLTNTEPFNFTGHPALSMPTGAVDGLPLGTMLVARRFEDDVLLRVAAAYERTHGWAADLPTAGV